MNATKNEEEINKLKFQKKKSVLAARFTQEEARQIREYCKKNHIKISTVIRYAFRKIISNTKI